MLGEASKILMANHGLIPIHFEISVWALRKGLTYAGRADQSTFAVDVKPAK
jgi:peptide/nickel transport system substrate-binding protein